MKHTLFSSFFKPQPQIKTEQKRILKVLHALQESTNLSIYFNVTIFHHAQRHTVPLLMYDEYRGLYIFESKDWTLQDLKNATIIKTKNQKPAPDTLAFDTTQAVIQRKFNEIIHTDGVEIINFLLMPNLTVSQYESLDPSLKTSLIQEKIIFADETKESILQKLHALPQSTLSLGSENKILGTLLTQYSIMAKDAQFYLLNKQQQAFIDSDLTEVTYLHGGPKTGKSSLLLLKAIFDILRSPEQKFIIIKPTNLAKDILHRQLIEIIEHAIIELDLLHIQIMTPADLFQSKKIKNTTLLCDDFNLLDASTRQKLLQNYKKANKVLVNADTQTPHHLLKKSYITQDRTVKFYQTQPYAKTLNILPNLLEKSEANDIIIVSDKQTAHMLQEDLESFIHEKISMIESKKNLRLQDLEGIKLAAYEDLNELSCEHIILLDIQSAGYAQLDFALNLANNSAHILFETESANIKQLKEKYESN